MPPRNYPESVQGSRAEFEYDIETIAIDLRWLSREIDEYGSSEATRLLTKIGIDISNTFEPFLAEVRKSKTEKALYSLNNNSTKYGDYKLPDDITADDRKWFETQLTEIERLVKAAVALADARSDIGEFPRTATISRFRKNGFAPPRELQMPWTIEN